MKTRALVLGGFAALAMGVGAVPAAAGAATLLPDDQNSPPNTLVVGGHDATESYEWMASLQRSGQHSCGASLIDDQWVLTAAHCVQGASPDQLGLRIGSPDHTTGGTEAGVAEIAVHPDYAAQSPNGDIALLKLDRTVQQEPVEIAEEAGAAGTPTRIIGWGLTCPVRGCGQPPEQLQELDTRIVADSMCSLSFIDGGTELCTGSTELLSNACFGDSGGPQLQGEPGDWKLIGVTSRLGSPVPVCGTAPSVYTDATAYTDWIEQHVDA